MSCRFMTVPHHYRKVVPLANGSVLITGGIKKKQGLISEHLPGRRHDSREAETSSGEHKFCAASFFPLEPDAAARWQFHRSRD